MSRNRNCVIRSSFCQAQKLCEDWTSNKGLGSELSLNPLGETTERTFRLKYVGVVPAERACSAPATAAAISQAVTQAKAGKRKLQRVDVTVSPKGITVEDATTTERVLEVSIYRISYCSADAAHSNIFAFIASGPNDILECHAFLCSKRKLARAATLAAAQSFNAAYQMWQTNQEKRLILSDKNKKVDDMIPVFSAPKALLIDFGGESLINTPWVSFEEEGTLDLWSDAPAARLLNPVIS
ncbi:low density lipoprotein receptor adapter protein 1-like isoform X2 [Arctopsyche grandis]|uniref:low density lipoprotein receptor adapter protein 1-like isoform X2 n=1 Tax=Arctopsyche grandis TaxID=121162 RepID=UPI00406D7DEA